MKRSTIILVIILNLSAFMFTGCRKELTVDPAGSGTNVNSIFDLKVPSTFNWATTREVSLNLAMNLPGVTYKTNTISIYDGDPYKDGNLVFTGYAANDFALVAKIRIPIAVTELYVHLTPLNAANQLVTLAVTDNISYTFTQTGGVKNAMNTDSGPDCSAAMAPYILSGVQNITISDGNTYYINDLASGSIDVKDGALIICGTYTGLLNMGDPQDASTVTVSSTGTATLTSMSKDDNSTLDNYGTLSIAGNFTPKDLVRNFGTMSIGASYLMNSGGPHSPELINSGMLTIGNEFNVHEKLTNNGTVEVMGHMNCNNSEIFNGCKIIVHLDFHLNNAEFTNQSGYLKVYQETFIQGGLAFMKLIDQSMISTYDLRMNGDITGSTTNSTINEVKVTNQLRFDGPNVVTGPVEVAQTNGVLDNGNGSNFTNGATFVSFANILNTIAASECNPEGINPPPPPPPPLTDNITTGTAVYEDLWPSKGDYDVNDLVVYYKYNLKTNSQNKVVDIVAKFYVKAAGAGLKNGFGFQIDGLTPDQISSVTGYNLQHGYVTLNANGTEAGQSKAVIMAWDNTDDVINRADHSSFFNTLPGTSVGTADTITITIHLATPLSTTVVGTAPFNPFLVKGMNRPVEVHLPDYIPTLLADQSYFGNSDDNSNAGIARYYKTNTNLPWALNIPVTFDYPFEFVDITQAYTHFAAWAQSGGVSYPNWYANNAGYRNVANIWHP